MTVVEFYHWFLLAVNSLFQWVTAAYPFCMDIVRCLLRLFAVFLCCEVFSI